eukprot:scaffold179_cov118-Isochrysis_galbana.AAC.2
MAALALSIAPDGGRVAVAGRELLRTFALGGRGPSEVVDLLAHTRNHSSHSLTDVTWLPQRPSQLVTASTSGEVLLWDTTRRGSKLVRTMAGHGRAVNRVSCNSSEPPRLLSGSQDCTVRLWDLNARSAAQLTFATAGEVRDVQWASPVGSSTAAGAAGAAPAPADGGSVAHLSYCFAVALETGSVQVFDYRTNRRALHAWQAHLGPAYALEYGLVGTQLLIATGGRDRFVHIWDAAGVSSVCAAADMAAAADARGGATTAWRPEGSSAPVVVQPLASVLTIAPVGRVKWRPSVLASAADSTTCEPGASTGSLAGDERLQLHIASCAAGLDGHLHLWDALRPQIPLYTLRLKEGLRVRAAASPTDRRREPRLDTGKPVAADRPIGETAPGQVEQVVSFGFLPAFGSGDHGNERIVALTKSGALTLLDVASAEPPYTNVSPVALCAPQASATVTHRLCSSTPGLGASGRGSWGRGRIAACPPAPRRPASSRRRLGALRRLGRDTHTHTNLDADSLTFDPRAPGQACTAPRRAVHAPPSTTPREVRGSGRTGRRASPPHSPVPRPVHPPAPPSPKHQFTANRPAVAAAAVWLPGMRLFDYGAPSWDVHGNDSLDPDEPAMAGVPLPPLAEFQSPRGAVSPSSTATSSLTPSTVTSPLRKVSASPRVAWARRDAEAVTGCREEWGGRIPSP